MPLYLDNRPSGGDYFEDALGKWLQQLRGEGTYTGESTMFDRLDPAGSDSRVILTQKIVATLQHEGTATLTVVVSGAGESAFDGVYARSSGDLWTKGDYIIQRSESENTWNMIDNSGAPVIFYFSADNPLFPWDATGWEAVSEVIEPAPTVTQG